MWYISAAPDVFIEILKVMNHTEQWHCKFAWYTPSASRQIYLNCLKHNHVIHSFNTLGKSMNPIILPPAMGK